MNEVIDVLVGGMQDHQSVKTDGICTCLTSSMGTGGGYVPMVLELDSICNFEVTSFVTIS